MLDVIDVASGRVIVLKLSGTIIPADYQTTMPVMEKAIAESKPKGLLLDWRELTGWAPEAESVALLVRVLHRSNRLVCPLCAVAGNGRTAGP